MSIEMQSAYLRNPDPFPSIPNGRQLYNAGQTDSEGHQTDDPEQHAQAPPGRTCSVRGCTNVLAPDYPKKMCELCRGRHRVYANTKRAKRKLEKAAMGAQSGEPFVWMDTNVEEGMTPPVSMDQYYGSTWDHRVIDPSLLTHESTLAGALTLPGARTQPSENNRRSQQQQQLEQSTSTDPGATKGSPNFTSTDDHGPSTQISESEKAPVPPRYCSVKGCKALVSGNSFFKMCDQCRDRYRSYGITKRAKWKKEKEAAVAQMERLRSEENQRRAEQGLPPFEETPPTWTEWQADGDAPIMSPDAPSASTSADPGLPLPPRMCTVSHCREILPGDYRYLRCERHRIQNRHHSKLKRVRDKEVKAQAFDGWAAVMGARGASEVDGDSREQTEGLAETSTESDDNEDALEADAVNAVLGPDTPFGVPSTGVPPAARGVRRTNHVCSIKVCFNLLSPSNPWKMCDSCRAKDRANRREKALRDSGVITTPPPRVPRKLKLPKSTSKEAIDSASADMGAVTTVGASDVVGSGEDTSKPKKKKKKISPSTVDDFEPTADSSSASCLPPEPQTLLDPDDSAQAVLSTIQNAGFQTTPSTTDITSSLVFANPLLPQPLPSTPASVSAPQQVNPNVSTADPFHIVSADSIASKVIQTEAPAAGKKSTKRKPKKNEASDAQVLGSSSGGVIDFGQSVDQPSDVGVAQGQPSASNPAVPPAAAASAFLTHVVQPTAPPTEASPAGVPSYLPYYVPGYGTTPYGSQTQPYSYGPLPPPQYSYPNGAYGHTPIYHHPSYPSYMPPYPYHPSAYPPPYGTQPGYPPPHYPPPPPSAPTTHPQPSTSASSGPISPLVPQTQPMFAVSSEFVSRAAYTAASQNGYHAQGQTQGHDTPGESMGSSTFTFSAKTGEIQKRAIMHVPMMRRKRQVDAEPAAPSAESANKQHESVPSAVIQAVPSAAPTPDPLATAVATISQAQAASEAAAAGAATAICNNKGCNRMLPVGNSGTLCIRCKERMKKRLEKAKQRFKLEPKKPVVGRKVDAGGSSSVEPGVMQAV